MKPSTLEHVTELANRHPALLPIQPILLDAFTLLLTSVRHGGKILTCGNGGSAADAEHIVGELMKGFLSKRPLTEKQKEALSKSASATYLTTHLQQAIPALSLTAGLSLPTAFSNDVAPDLVFAQQLLGLGKPGDVLWAISTSGNSTNILYAIEVAKSFQIKTIGLTGNSGGKMKALCDVCICVPSDHTPVIQEWHLPVYHTLCAMLESELFE